MGVLMPSRPDPSNPSLSNNSLLAPCKTVDAMEDSWTPPSSGLPKETPSSSSQPTHTPPEEDKEDLANKTKGVGTVSGHHDVSQGSASQMRAALNGQPVSVAIEADQMAFQSYTSGVITTGCGQQLDHGVLAVGYGTLNGSDFVLVKNSWGAGWGDNGYVRIGTANNSCGVLNAASYPKA